MTRRYKIRQHEDGQCPWCGFPLDVGDYAYEDHDGFEAGYCSPTCFAEAREQRIRREAISPSPEPRYQR